MNNLPTILPPPQTSNRQSSQGSIPTSARNRAARIVNTIVAAGQTVPLYNQGSNFYLIAASAPINIRPRDGAFNSYSTGQGNEFNLDSTFDVLELQNTSAFPITISLYVGWSNFIDHRLILAGAVNSIAFPTAGIPGVLTSIQIPDLSGQAFTDINGQIWLAVQRQYIVISNVDTATIQYLRKLGGAPGDPAVLAVQPTFSASLPLQGDYSINNGGGVINAVVSEIYNAILPTQ